MPRTFMKVIKNGNFLNWKGLKNQQFFKTYTPSIATALVQLDQYRKNLQSTNQVKSEKEIEEDKYFYPDIEKIKTHELRATIIPFNINREGFSDLNGAFPHKSSWRNLCVMIMYDYDSNEILYKQIKNKQTETIRDTFSRCTRHKILKSRVGSPKFYIMENECSSELKEAMKKIQRWLPTCPPHMRHQNAVEWSIRICNNNFI